MKMLQSGCDILVVSPGRGGHLISEQIVDARDLKILVLDEADELLREEFGDQMEKIFSYLPPVSS
jgi:ATP-dependent RNA helicase RhlE